MIAAIALTVATASTVIFGIFDNRLFEGREQVARLAGWAAIWYGVAAVAIFGL